MKLKVLSFFALCCILFTACIQVEKKEYTFEFTGENSGKLTIKYINIFSPKESDTLDVSAKDYAALVSDYLEGDKLEANYPFAKNFKKRLFEENGVLCGEVTMEFDNLDVAKLYKYDKVSPYMYYYKGGSSTEEKLLETNGKSTNSMPVVFWDKGSKKLTLTTKLDDPTPTTVSLLDQYKKNKK